MSMGVGAYAGIRETLAVHENRLNAGDQTNVQLRTEIAANRTDINNSLSEINRELKEINRFLRDRHTKP